MFRPGVSPGPFAMSADPPAPGSAAGPLSPNRATRSLSTERLHNPDDYARSLAPGASSACCIFFLSPSADRVTGRSLTGPLPSAVILARLLLNSSCFDILLAFVQIFNYLWRVSCYFTMSGTASPPTSRHGPGRDPHHPGQLPLAPSAHMGL